MSAILRAFVAVASALVPAPVRSRIRFLGPPVQKPPRVIVNNGVRRREAKRAEWRAWNAARVARGWKPRRRPKTKRERRAWLAQLRAVLTGGAS